MGRRDDILALAADYAGQAKDCAGQEDLLGVFGLTGDDASEFLEDYAERFDVDMSGMLWYFHYDANDLPRMPRHVLPIGADGMVLPLRPITLDDLVAAAEAGQWTVNYPEHRLRRSRWWVLNIALVTGFALAALVLWVVERWGC